MSALTAAPAARTPMQQLMAELAARHAAQDGVSVDQHRARLRALAAEHAAPICEACLGSGCEPFPFNHRACTWCDGGI